MVALIAQVAPNLVVYTGAAEYGQPAAARMEGHIHWQVAHRDLLAGWFERPLCRQHDGPTILNARQRGSFFSGDE